MPASLGKRLTSAALFVTRPAAIRHPSPTRGRWLAAVVADQLKTEKISSKSKIISEYIYRLYLRHAITLKVVV